jgi:hypothetical protein
VRDLQTLGIAKFISLSILCSAFVLPLYGQQPASTGVQANPGRPTISTPATLTPVGYLQFESGALVATHSPEFSSQLSMNEVVKLTVAPRLQFILSSEPVARSRAGGRTGIGTGGEFLGLQGVFLAGKGARPTLAASYFHEVYAGNVPDLDLGGPSQSAVILASTDVHGFHFDINFLANQITQGGVRRAQFGQTLSIAHPLSKRFSLSAEWWHFTQPFTKGRCAGSLWAIGYAPRGNLVLDAGFNRGLTSTSTRWQTFVGFTYVFPHSLWGKS